MKKIRYILIMSLLSGFCHATIVGKIAVVSGQAYIQHDSVQKIAKNNMSLEDNDIIKTSKESTVQIVFFDDSVATVGPNSVFDLVSYPLEGDKGPSLKVSKGIFKFVTGNMSKIAKQNFKLQTKTTTMGIRGTQLIIQSNDENEIFLCTHGAIAVKHNNEGDEQIIPAGYSILSTQNGLNKIDKINVDQLKDLNKQFQASSKIPLPVAVSNLSNFFGKESVDAAEESASYLTESQSDVSTIFNSMSNKKGMVGAVISSMISSNNNGYIAITPVSDSSSIGYLSFYEPMIQIFPYTVNGQNYSEQSAIYEKSFIPDTENFQTVFETSRLQIPYNALFSNNILGQTLYFDNLKQFYSWQTTMPLQNDLRYTELGFAGKQSNLSDLPKNQFLVYENVINQNIISSLEGISTSNNQKSLGAVINTLNKNILIMSLDGNVEYGTKLFQDENGNGLFAYSYNGNDNKLITAQGKLYGDYFQGFGLLNTYLKDNENLYSQISVAYRKDQSLPFLPSTPETGTSIFNGYSSSWRQNKTSFLPEATSTNPIEWSINKDTGSITGTISCKMNSVACALDSEKSAYIATSAFKAQSSSNDITVNIFSQIKDSEEYDAYASAGVYYSIDDLGIENGVFIAGELTKRNEIDSLIQQSKTYNYDGTVSGYVLNSTTDSIDYINAEASSFNAKIDFGSSTPVSGSAYIESFGADGVVKKISANIDSLGSQIVSSNASFSANFTQGNEINNVNINSGSLNGLIYGQSASSIGGKFEINGHNSESQNLKTFGIFKAQKQ